MKKNQKETNLQSIKADILLISQISKPSKISHLQTASDLEGLHALLKQKNKKCNISKDQQKQVRDWLNNSGVNLYPLISEINREKQQTAQRKEIKKKQEDCLFYISNMSHKKIDEYLQKAHEYGNLNIIQKNFKKENISRRIMNQIKNKFSETGKFRNQNQQQNVPGLVSSLTNQVRNQEKKQRYIKCVEAMANNVVERKDLVHQISRNINMKIWKIFSRHVRSLQQIKHNDSISKTSYLCIQSLRLLEEEFSEELPKDPKGLNYYLKHNYIQKLQKNNCNNLILDNEGSSFWGKLYILYRAGRKVDFYNLLASSNQPSVIGVMKDFKLVDESIKQKNPIAIDKYKNVKRQDVFKNQLLYSLSGQRKCQDNVFAGSIGSEYAWMLIRNQGIFSKNTQNSFEQLRQKVFSNYKQSMFLSDQQLYNYLFLLGYEQMAERGLTSIMDQDDYIHFLICLAENYQLMSSRDSLVLDRLSKYLIGYINQLICTGRQQFIYYMTLFPFKGRVAQISDIISVSNLVSSFDWSQLRNKISTKQEFVNIVHRTLQKYISIPSNYLVAAQKYVELLEDYESAVKCLLKYLIKNFSNSLGIDSQVLHAENMCSKYFYSFFELKRRFEVVLDFISQCRKLTQLFKQQNYLEFYQTIKNTEFIPLGRSLTAKQHNLFANLIQLSQYGLQAYFKLVKYVIKGLQHYYLRSDNNSQFRRFLLGLQQSVNFILSFQDYHRFEGKAETQEVLSLINELINQFSLN